MWGNPILVIGSGRGMGERIDRTLVREGAAVVVHSRDEERAGRVAAEIRDATAPRPKTYYVVDDDARIGMLYWPSEEGDRRATTNVPPVDAELGYDIVDKLDEIARARGATVTQTALAWTLSRSFITSVIVGASRIGQLEDNLSA